MADETDTAAAAAPSDAPGADTPATDTGGTEAATEPKSGREVMADAVSRAMAGEADDGEDAPDSEDEGDADTDAAEGEDEGAEVEGDKDDGTKTEGAEDQAKGADADDDLTPPAGLSQKASERFGKLVERIKTTDAAHHELQQKFTGIEQTLRGTGATPEQWGKVLTLMRYGNSGDPQQARDALEILDGYRAEIAAVAGVPVQGVDVLGDFPDLRAKVETGDLDEATAAELAAARRFQKKTKAGNDEAEQQRGQQAQFEQRRSTAQQRMDAVGKELAGKDIDFARKVDLLKTRGFFEHIVANVPPENWEAMFRAGYDALGDAVSSQRTPAPRKQDQPMRSAGKTGASGSAQPKTIAEAVRMAVAED